MPDQARRPFLQSSLTGLLAMCIPVKGWARRPPPRAQSPLVGVDPLLVDTGLTGRWQAAMRQDLGWAAQWEAADSGQVLDLIEKGEVNAGLFLSHPRADRLVQQGLIYSRQRIARTDVLLLCPPDDLAGIRGETDIARALAQVRAAVAAGAASWQAPLPGSALEALAQAWMPGGASMAPPAGRPAPAAPAYRLMTRAQWLRQPPKGERLKPWPGNDPRMVLHAEIGCAYRNRHEGAKLLVSWLQWPLAQGAVKSAQPGWQRIDVKGKG